MSVLVYNCTLSVDDALVLWHNRSAAPHHSLYRERYKVTDGREELSVCSRVFLKKYQQCCSVIQSFF